MLLQNEELYKQRFAHFNSQFYKRIYSKEYPLEYAEQALFVERPDDRILFIGLNSCWQVDHEFKNRAEINMEALTKAIDRYMMANMMAGLKSLSGIILSPVKR